MKSIIKKILTILEWTVIAVIAVIFLIVTSSLIPGSYIGKSYIIVSESMQPTIPVGSMVITFPQQSYTISDIIAFQSPADTDKIIMHRAYRRNAENTGWITKGDGNEEVDNWIVADSLVRGRAVGFIPHIGKFASEARTPRGFLLYIGLPVLLIMILYCFKIVRGVKEYARQEAAKAVETYRKSQNIRQITLSLLSLLSIIAIPTMMTLPYAYATFTDKVTTQIIFTTASPVPTSIPSPTALPSVPPGTVILNQTGSSTTININATTQGGNVTVGVNSQVISQQSQSIE